jgi:hypothetical protein
VTVNKWRNAAGNSKFSNFQPNPESFSRGNPVKAHLYFETKETELYYNRGKVVHTKVWNVVGAERTSRHNVPENSIAV